MMIAGIDTLTAVTAILSLSVKSRIDLTSGRLTLSHIGVSTIPATPLTSLPEPLVRAQMMMIAGGPLVPKSICPESSPSFIAAGLLSVMNTPFTSPSPASLVCFSTSFCSSITISGKKPMPYCLVMRTSLTSACAPAAASAAAINAAINDPIFIKTPPFREPLCRAQLLDRFFLRAGLGELSEQAAAVQDFRVDSHYLIGLPRRRLHRRVNRLAEIALEHVDDFECAQLGTRDEHSF